MSNGVLSYERSEESITVVKICVEGRKSRLSRNPPIENTVQVLQTLKFQTHAVVYGEGETDGQVQLRFLIAPTHRGFRAKKL